MLIVNIVGIALIALIVWWFWLYKPEEVELQGDSMEIKVENGIYSPAFIRLKAGEAVSLTFIRKDASPCSETVVFPEIEISETLPLNKPKQVNLPPLAAGEYEFHCQMKMYQGKLKVE